MKKTIVLLGVGSTYFTKGIVESVIKHGGEWELRLVDIDPVCLEIAVLLAKKLVETNEATVEITSSTERKDVLSGADAVVSTIGVGGRKAWEKDAVSFRQFGIHQHTSDTYGPGGVSRALRTVPVMVEIARDMEKLCPKALLVNFTNPMTVNCWALNKVTKIKTIGLCYGVTYFQHKLATFIGVPFEETWTKAIGTNHFTWITEFRHLGKDMLPILKAKMKETGGDVTGVPPGPYTWELFETFGAYPCVGDGHICEFVPGFERKGAHFGKTFGLEFEEYNRQFDKIFQDMADMAYGRKPLEKLQDNKAAETFRDEDLFIDVLSATMGGKPVERTVNLSNTGQVPNLPLGAVIEGTTLVNSAGFHPLCYEELPVGITAILQRILGAQALTVEAALKADRNLIVQAFMADLTAVKKADAEKITDCILEMHREYLPQFYK